MTPEAQNAADRNKTQLLIKKRKIMRCAACHNEMVTKKGEVDLRIGGKLYIVRNATYKKCPACEEQVISPKVSQNLFEKIKSCDRYYRS